ncbi:MAG: PIN domain-containing protein [Selenomonadaceae bacterium]|nr:PIN domain-containing protein [Selenomonadaceae bacterium]
MTKRIFDTNMILRYLLKDNPIMYEKSKHLLKQDNVWVTLEVIAEVVYVLRRVYFLDRPMISKQVRALAELVKCKENSVLNLAMDTYATKNLDFVDCVLYAYNKVDGFEIATFDKQLLRLINSDRTDSD